MFCGIFCLLPLFAVLLSYVCVLLLVLPRFNGKICWLMSHVDGFISLFVEFKGRLGQRISLGSCGCCDGGFPNVSIKCLSILPFSCRSLTNLGCSLLNVYVNQIRCRQDDPITLKNDLCLAVGGVEAEGACVRVASRCGVTKPDGPVVVHCWTNIPGIHVV